MVYRKGVFLIYFFVFFLPNVAFSQKDSPIVIRESSLAQTLKETLAENKRLKQEKENLEEKLNGAVMRANIFAERIRRLNDQIENLQSRITSLQEEEQQEKETIQSELNQQLQACADNLEDSKEKNKSLRKFIASIQKKREQDEYFSMWQEAEQELMALKVKLKELATAKERLTQESGKAHYNLGNLFFRNGKYAKAAAEYEMALNALPEDADIYYNLAVLYDYYLDDSEKAKVYYSKYLRKNPGADESLFVKERIAENGFKSKFNEAD